MADYEVTDGREVVINGTPDTTYNYVWIPFFQVNTPSKVDPNVYASIQFRHYRIVDGNYEDAPLDKMPPPIQVNLTEVLGNIEGGTDLYAAVTSALVGLGKAYGVI